MTSESKKVEFLWQIKYVEKLGRDEAKFASSSQFRIEYMIHKSLWSIEQNIQLALKEISLLECIYETSLKIGKLSLLSNTNIFPFHYLRKYLKKGDILPFWVSKISHTLRHNDELFLFNFYKVN
ncbi:hypothetical protein, partial [Leptospira jelokensis]|uniref:hypothetical protein n=1 Tax=Leptospira jelokensis TaxID=2484931 RepID=UPI001ABF5D5E